MKNVFSIHKKNPRFTQETAQNLLPTVSSITLRYFRRIESLITRLENSPTQEDILESEINQEIQGWQDKMNALGIEPKGLWVADFPAKDGYFCWKFPEDKIDHFHGVNEGLNKRKKID